MQGQDGDAHYALRQSAGLYQMIDMMIALSKSGWGADRLNLHVWMVKP